MDVPFITEASKNLAGDAGVFRVTRRANALTGEVHYAAYEPLAFMGSHNTFKREDERWWGNVSERSLPEDLDRRFSGRLERQTAVEAFYKANRELAHALIVQAFPEAARGAPVLGIIVLPFAALPESAQARARNAPVYDRHAT